MITQSEFGFKFVNAGLFADHYLSDRLSQDIVWKATRTESLRSIFDKVIATYGESGISIGNGTKEAELEHVLIRKILDILWSEDGKSTYKVQPSIERYGANKAPDYALFHTIDNLDLSRTIIDNREQWKLASVVGEAKKWGISLDKITGERTPGIQITNYLYITGVRWGILTNGEVWRLYERERSRSGPIFYEANLSEIVRSESIEDFKQFYFFFSREGYIPDDKGKCFVDRVLDGSREYAVEVSKNLKERVYDALPILIEGFLSYSANKLNRWNEDDIKTCHECGLIVLYRLLFILFAEDRKLLPVELDEYRIYGLRALADDIKSKEKSYLSGRTRIWPQLCDLFRQIDCGDADLQIPAYNGGLFSPEKYERISYIQSPSENHLAIGDKYISQVILRLAFESDKQQEHTSRKVDYATLDVQHLGAIYEGLLELKPYIAHEEIEETEIGKIRKYNPHQLLKTGGKKKDQKSGRVLRIIAKGDIYLATNKDERRSTGSYYTPKYIVDYIVEKTLSPLVEKAREETESIGQSLQKKIGIIQNTLKSRPHPNEKTKARNELRELYTELMSPYLNLKILDPAIGSGHFLVGAADYLARAMAEDETLIALIESAGKNGEEPQAFYKRLITEHCLYGVDINPLAVELAKLSLWLHTASRGRVLSFLDHHVRVGNSLLGARIERDLENVPLPSSSRERSKLINSGRRGQIALGLTETLTSRHLSYFLDSFRRIADLPSDTRNDEMEKEAIYKKLDETRNPFREAANVWLAPFYGSDYEVTEDLYQQVVDALTGTEYDKNLLKTQDWFNDIQKLAETKRFFHWEIEFPDAFFESKGTSASWKSKDKQGFDAIIGNPPYVRQEGLGVDKPAFEYLWSDIYQGTADIYTCFLGLGLNLLTETGMLGMITSNKYMRSNYGRKLRDYIFEHIDIQNIVDFGELPVFEDASTFPCVVIMKYGELDETRFTQIKSLDFVGIHDLARIELDESVPLRRESFEGENWSLASGPEVAIMRKMEAAGMPLGKWLGEHNIYIRRGIVTGFNEAFILNKQTYDKLIKEDKKSAEIIKPLIVGDDIRRYRINYKNRYVIFTRRGLRIEEFPAIKKHLENYRNRLTPKSASDSEMEGRKPGEYEWYEIQDTTDYYMDFEKPKIVYPDIAIGCRFSYDNSGFHVEATAFLIPDVPLYMLALLNSKLLEFYISSVTPILGERGSSGRRRFKTAYLHNLPIPKLKEKVQKTLTSLSEKLLEFNACEQQEENKFLAWLSEYLGVDLKAIQGKYYLEKYNNLEFPRFKDILVRNKNKLRYDPEDREPAEKLRWHFEDSLSRIAPLERDIADTDRKIDQIVYGLYGLTEDEIKIVEGNGE